MESGTEETVHRHAPPATPGVAAGMRRTGRRGDRRWAALSAALMSAAALAGASPAAGEISFPTARQVIDRVLTTARQTDLTSTDMVIKFRIAQPVTAPPVCVFSGTLQISAERLALAMKRWTRSPLCWVIERLGLERLFRDRDRVDALLPEFRFEVIGEKLVAGRRYYLLEGRALTSGTDPAWMMGWVDYDRGLIIDGTARYAWGEVDSEQEYAPVGGLWVPVRQYLSIPRFRASLEISYSNFQFASGQGGSVRGGPLPRIAH